ncbi:hypothetical protein LAV79_11705 [Peribacillus butanolivorans]
MIASVFSAIIIVITVYSMVKVCLIAYNRNEISLRKFIIFTTSLIVIVLIVASVLPFGYQKVIGYIY